MASGSFTVFCPIFINETSPDQLKGPAGAMFQVIVQFGIFVAMVIISFAPEGEELIDAKNENQNCHLIIILVFVIPIFISII